MQMWPQVTVAMPCLNEARYIVGSLGGVLMQDYPSDRMEVLVVDGGSDDGTREIVARIAAQDGRVKLIDNPGRHQSAGMNAAIRVARGDIIVRMDAHCEYQRDYVRQCVEELERTGADNVGGAQRLRAVTAFQRAVCAALASPLGTGGAAYRSADKEGFVDTVYLGAFPRRVFEVVGLYDPMGVTNEDAELNLRIHAAGGKVYLSRKIVVHYYPRDSFPNLARQYFGYGLGRARTLLKLRTRPAPRSVIPAAMLAVAVALLVPGRVHSVAMCLCGALAALTAAEAVRVGWRAGLTATVWAIFPVLYVSHGLGVVVGLVRYLARPDWGDPERLPKARGTDSPQ